MPTKSRIKSHTRKARHGRSSKIVNVVKRGGSKTSRKVNKTPRKSSRKAGRKASRKKSRKASRKQSRKASRKKSRKASRTRSRKFRFAYVAAARKKYADMQGHASYDELTRARAATSEHARKERERVNIGGTLKSRSHAELHNRLKRMGQRCSPDKRWSRSRHGCVRKGMSSSNKRENERLARDAGNSVVRERLRQHEANEKDRQKRKHAQERMIHQQAQKRSTSMFAGLSGPRSPVQQPLSKRGVQCRQNSIRIKRLGDKLRTLRERHNLSCPN